MRCSAMTSGLPGLSFPARIDSAKNALAFQSGAALANGVFAATAPGDAVADALTARGRKAVATMPAALETLPRSETPFLPKGTVGLEALRAMSAPNSSSPSIPSRSSPARCRPVWRCWWRTSPKPGAASS